MKARIELETDEPVLVLVIPLAATRPSVKPPRKCAQRKLVVTTGEEIGEVIPFASKLRRFAG